ncbi:MAG: CTP--2,3-di-O-geranylgeranyl-sn-glycero-1-phosphate cytidyltransferase [Candidatus Nanohalarchaeota archaeon]|nr:MAG: CTP--2,3-di-O-geranylgeranyl-sn-glycero-1-phosphate cytidyltransferase [Candidatus Nanohaloarchaeota archaeon]
MNSSKTKKYSFATELIRKLIHLNALFIVLLYEFFGKQITLVVLMIALVIALGAEYLRIEHGMKIPFFDATYRRRERKALGGHVFFVIGAILVISVFSKEVAIISILMTVFGDAAAAIFGRAYGKHYISGLKNKAIEGVFAEFVADMFVGIIYLWLFVGTISPVWWFILIAMATVATIVETISRRLDDNLLIPVFSGIVGESLLLIIAIVV